MKKILCLTALSAFITFSCKPKDKNEPAAAADSSAPVISLSGKSKDTVSLNTTYTDPGASATDDVDGNISASIATTGNVNTNLVGDYTKKYNVKDVAGNNAAEVTRLVHVRNDADYLVGNYAAIPNCGSTASFNYASGITVSTTQNNQIMFSNLLNNATGSPIPATVNGSNITIPLKTSGSNSFGGNGTISTNKKVLTLTTIAGNASGGYPCTSVLTKQ